jgi:hypothetical protein
MALARTFLMGAAGPDNAIGAAIGTAAGVGGASLEGALAAEVCMTENGTRPKGRLSELGGKEKTATHISECGCRYQLRVEARPCQRCRTPCECNVGERLNLEFL